MAKQLQLAYTRYALALHIPPEPGAPCPARADEALGLGPLLAGMSYRPGRKRPLQGNANEGVGPPHTRALPAVRGHLTSIYIERVGEATPKA